MVRTLLLLAALTVTGALGGQLTTVSAATVNCSSFPSQAAAQAAYRADPAGLANLDSDRDGIACEDNPAPYDRTPVVLPGAGTPTPAPTPTPTGSKGAPVNCSSYGSQAAAQAAYRADPVALAHLDADHDGIACEDNPAPYDLNPVILPGASTPTPTPAPASSGAARVNCSSYPSQAAAQAAYRANPVGLANLDADRDGIACENNPAPYDRTPVDLSASRAPSAGLPSAPATGDGSTQAATPPGLPLLGLAGVLLLAVTGGSVALGQLDSRLRRRQAADKTGTQ